MNNSDRNVLLYAAAATLAVGALWVIESRSGAGRVEADRVAPHSPPTASPTGCPTAQDGIDDAAGTSFSNGQVAQTDSTSRQSAGELQALAGPPHGDAGSSPALASTFADFSDEMQPTADGLAASTIDPD